MEVATADADAVSAKINDEATNDALATNLASEGIDGVTVAVTEVPTVQENTSTQENISEAEAASVEDDGSAGARVVPARAEPTCACMPAYMNEYTFTTSACVCVCTVTKYAAG